MIDEAVISRFRARVADLHSVTGSLREVERRVNDAIRYIQDLRTERQRLATPRYRDAGFGARLVQVDVTVELASLDGKIAATEGEIDGLRQQHERLSQRRDDAARIAGRCRDLLVQRGMAPAQLEF